MFRVPRRLKMETPYWQHALFYRAVLFKDWLLFSILSVVFKPEYYDPTLNKMVPMTPTGDHAPDELTAVIRLASEPETVEPVLTAAMECVDRLLIVLNRPDIQTRSIAQTFGDRYPDRVKIYSYQYPISKVGSKEHDRTRYNSPYNLANLTNFALSMVETRWAIKVDGDDLLIPGSINEWKKNKKVSYFYGVNPGRDPEGLRLSKGLPLSGGLDHFILDTSKPIFFVKTKNFEKVLCSRFSSACIGVAYIHLKNLKKDRGERSIGNGSKFWLSIDSDLKESATIDPSDFCHRFPQLLDLKSVQTQWDKFVGH